SVTNLRLRLFRMSGLWPRRECRHSKGAFLAPEESLWQLCLLKLVFHFLRNLLALQFLRPVLRSHRPNTLFRSFRRQHIATTQFVLYAKAAVSPLQNS